jgi:hypothetical protein
MAGMYPADEILSIFGEQVQWPGLDPANGKFTNGSFTDPLVKPSFIPAETVNLILDNLAGLITACGGTPNSTSADQLKNAVIAKLAPLASMEWVKSTVWPIGTVYTQYPATDAAGNPVATGDPAAEFPASQAPAALFGGTWIACFENESVFFRSGGKTNLSTDGRSNGWQGDAIRNVTGTMGTVISDPNYTNGAIGSVLSDKALPSGYYYGTRQIWLDSSLQVPVAGENRPVNRRKIIWKKTAMAV